MKALWTNGRANGEWSRVKNLPLLCDMGEEYVLLVRASQSLGQMEHNFVPTDQKIVINLFRFRCCAT